MYPQARSRRTLVRLTRGLVVGQFTCLQWEEQGSEKGEVRRVVEERNMLMSEDSVLLPPLLVFEVWGRAIAFGVLKRIGQKGILIACCKTDRRVSKH
jgi:hypothetical protein